MMHHLLDTLAGRLLYALLVLAPVLIALIRREARNSWLVRAGGVLLALSLALVMLAPSLLIFALFYFLAPFAILLMLVGIILSFVTPGQRLRHDVEALVAAARRSTRVWPDDPPLAETNRVVRHGPAAGPVLVSLLQFDSAQRMCDEAFSTSLEQQLELALCGIYGETPRGAHTVYDVRAIAADNCRVKPFWQAKVTRAR